MFDYFNINEEFMHRLIEENCSKTSSGRQDPQQDGLHL